MKEAGSSPSDGEAVRLLGVEVRHGPSVALAIDDLRVEPGETVALVGPNGAGKSTLLHVAALLRRPDRGEVRLFGERATTRSEARLRRETALVFQAPLLFDTSLLDNAASGLRFRGASRAGAVREARSWLDRFGVGHLAARRAREVSGGEAQRASLARAFATRPRLLLLDEPFAALDAATRAGLLPALRGELGAGGATAIFVTHDLDDALALGDRLGVLLAGRLAQIDVPADVLSRPATVAVARLLGIDNLLPARVLAVAPDGARLRLGLAADGPVVRSGRGDPAAIAPGAAVALALRAGDLAVGPANADPPPGWNNLGGVVRAARAALAGMTLTIDADAGLELAALVPRANGPTPLPGDRVAVAFPPDAAHPLAPAAS